jgi:hypothetical protein
MWIGGLGLATVLLFLKDHDAAGKPLPEHLRWIFLFAWIGGGGFIWWGYGRLKRVRVDGTSLYISNYRKEITVPLREIRMVSENRWINIHPVTIEFWVGTAFGQRIVFMPQAQTFAFFGSHPVVAELRRLAAEATGLAPRAGLSATSVVAMKRTTAWCLGFFGALTFYWSAATFLGFDWGRNYRLYESSAQAEARVARVEPANHCAAYFEFEVAGDRYQGSGSVCGARVGDSIRVYYLPGEPTFSTLKRPGDDLVFMIVSPLLLSTVAGVVAILRFGRRRDEA